MGIDIYCGDTTFGCSYSFWDTIRTEIYQATMDYIQTLDGDEFYLKILKEGKKSLHFMNALNYYDIGGLLALMNQSDCEGYYTVGNSLDICMLLNKIKPFLEKYSCYDCVFTKDERLFNTVYEVFECSHKNMKKVTIS